MKPIRIFLADDHELVRMALKTLLEGEPDLEVVGEAADTESAVKGTVDTEPDLLLLDLRMPGGGGIEACSRVKSLLPDTRVLVISSFGDDEEVFGVLDAGANGYIMKDTRPDLVSQAIRSIMDGQAVFDGSVASRIITGRQVGGGGNAMLADPLSEREIEVLELMAKGRSNKDISHELWIGETTVKTHVSHILRKLGQGDRTQAVVAALRAGIVQLDEGA